MAKVTITVNGENKFGPTGNDAASSCCVEEFNPTVPS